MLPREYCWISSSVNGRNQMLMGGLSPSKRDCNRRPSRAGSSVRTHGAERPERAELLQSKRPNPEHFHG
jgi:hypothetical protein